MAKPIPEGYHTMTPILTLKNSRQAIEFYKKAFGAKERFLMPTPDGKGVAHAELAIGDSPVMLSDENPQHQCPSATSLGGSPVSFYLYVKDADALFEQAVAAGATVKMPMQNMFWGDRAGCVEDPFGHSWMIGTHIEDLTPDQIAKRAQEAFATAPK